MLYAFVRLWIRLALSVFFRQIEVVGQENLGKDGERALLLAGNHPNSLLDPALIVATCDRHVHLLGKDVLFKSPVLRPILRALGAVPVQRKMDHAGEHLDNRGAFEVLAQVLAAGGAMGIFPEGISHDEAQLQKIKTGAARIVLETVKKYDQPVDVVPVGLTYLNPKRFRSRVLVQYGDPIVVGPDLVELWLRDEPAAVRDLTQKVQTALRALTVNAVDWETLRVLDAVRRLYQPPGVTLWQRVELARRFNEVYPTVQNRPEVVALVERVRNYQGHLEDLGLTDRDLQRELRWPEILGRGVMLALDTLFWLPLALPGLALQAPVAGLVRWAVRFSPRKDVVATTKLVLGLLLAPILLAVMTLLVAANFGNKWGILVAILLPLGAYAALRTLERGVAFQRRLHAAWRMTAFREAYQALRQEREKLQDDIITLVDQLRPAEMTPLFEQPLPTREEP